MLSAFKARAFTLIEVMIVIALAAILLGIAAPSFQVTIQNSAVRAAYNDLTSAINLARQHSVSLRIDIELEPIDSDWSNGWQLKFAANDSKNKQDNYRFKPRQGVIVKSNLSSISFKAGGGLADDDASFSVAHTNSNAVCKSFDLSFFGKIEPNKKGCP